MIVYSDVLTMEDLERACDFNAALYLNDARLVEGRKRRFEGVTIRATSALRAPDWREHDSSAMRGGVKSFPQFATYDEHGQWMARLFEVDPRARIKSAVNDFHGREDFHRQTSQRYERAAV